MSKYDKCAYRYPDDCPFDCCKVPREKHVPGMSHAFVEPVTAPQPPADAVPFDHDAALDACGLRDQARGAVPAAPPVTGDGDGDASDEVIAAEMAMEEIDTFGPPEDEDALAGIITKAIARGRALGARDAFGAAIEEVRALVTSKDKILARWETKNYGGAAKDGLIGAIVMSEEIITAIARRAGREGK